jgi:hypothetical protein
VIKAPDTPSLPPSLDSPANLRSFAAPIALPPVCVRKWLLWPKAAKAAKAAKATKAITT